MKDGLVNLLKFVLAVVLVPAVVAAGCAFHQELLKLDRLYEVFLYGMAVYVLLNLFIAPCEAFYSYGQKLFGDFFKGSFFLGSFVPRIIPLYLTLLLVVYYVLSALLKVRLVDTYFMFFAGFLLTMHIILTSQEIQAEDASATKGHYFLTAGLIFVISLLFIALLFHLDFSKFQYLEFLKTFWSNIETIYTSVYKKILLIK